MTNDHSLSAISHKPLFGDFTADLFEIGNVIKSGTLIFGVTVSADAEGYFSLNSSLSRMSLSFPVTGFTLNPP
jgi:hypothetical protein